MFIQFIVLLLSYIAFEIYSSKAGYFDDINRKKYIFFVMFLFILQSGLRHLAIGDDTFAYYLAFNDVKTENWNQYIMNFVDSVKYSDSKDPSYYLLCKLFSMIIPSFRMFLIAVAIFFFISYGRILYKYTTSLQEVLVSVALYQCLYYSFMSITGIRQTIATSFLLLAVPYILNKNMVKAIFFIIIAATQHKSALLFSGFLFLSYIKNSRNFLILSFIAFIPMNFVGGKIAEYIMINSGMDQYANLLNQYDGAGAYSFMAYILFLNFCILIQNKNLTTYMDKNYVFINALAVALFLTPLTTINPSNMRIVQYYSFFGLIILPHFCSVLYLKNNMNLYKIVFFVLAVYTVFIRNSIYGFFWEDMMLPPIYGINDYINEFDL